jgi:hypothetical protein
LAGGFTRHLNVAMAISVLVAYGAVFLLMTIALRVPEARTAIGRVVGRFRATKKS